MINKRQMKVSFICGLLIVLLTLGYSYVRHGDFFNVVALLFSYRMWLQGGLFLLMLLLMYTGAVYLIFRVISYLVRR